MALPDLPEAIAAFALKKCPPILKRIHVVQEKEARGEASPFELASAKKWIEGCIAQFNQAQGILPVPSVVVPPSPEPSLDYDYVPLVDQRDKSYEGKMDHRSQMILSGEGDRLICAYRRGWITEWQFKMQCQELSRLMNLGKKITREIRYEVYGYGTG